MRESRFQINVATGRMTLPVAILFCLMIWVMSLDSWKDLGTLGITVLTGYLMIETNTAFSLIRTRTSLPVSIYWCLFSALVFLHTFEWNCFTPLAFLLAVVHLYRSYESPYASANIFHAFFFLSLGSLAFPQLRSFAPRFLSKELFCRIIGNRNTLLVAVRLCLLERRYTIGPCPITRTVPFPSH